MSNLWHKYYANNKSYVPPAESDASKLSFAEIRTRARAHGDNVQVVVYLFVRLLTVRFSFPSLSIDNLVSRSKSSPLFFVNINVDNSQSSAVLFLNILRPLAIRHIRTYFPRLLDKTRFLPFGRRCVSLLDRSSDVPFSFSKYRLWKPRLYIGLFSYLRQRCFEWLKFVFDEQSR